MTTATLDPTSSTTQVATELVAGNRQQGAWLDRLMLATVVVASALALSNNGADPDLWGHVLYGQDALRSGLPTTATYTFTAEGYPWINHEILSEYLLAIGFETIGPRGLLLVKMAFAVLLTLVVLRHAARQGASPVLRSLIVILTATNLTFFWLLRPQLFSFCLFAALLGLLTWCFEGWEGNWQLHWRNLFGKKSESDSNPTANDSELKYSSKRLRGLWAAPVLFFVWANTHGAFLAGLAIYYVYLFCRGFEAWSCMGTRAIGLLKRFGLMAAAATAATLVNPYSYRLHVWLIESLLPPRPEIVEWLPPEISWSVAATAWIPFWILLALSVSALLFSKRSIDFTHLVIFSIIVWQAVEHRRHIALVAILFAYWMPRHIVGFMQRCGFGAERANENSAEDRGAVLMRRLLGGLMACSLMMLSYCLADQLNEVTVRKDQYPVAAFQYIADQDLQGKMVVAFDWAQYALMAFGAEHPGDRGIQVQFDGRYDTCYPRQIVDMTFDFEIGYSGPKSRYRDPASPPVDPSRVLSFGDPNLLVVSRHKVNVQETVKKHAADWTLLYQDSLAQVWGRANQYDNPEHSNYLPPAKRQISDAKQEGMAAWPALPTRVDNFKRTSNVGRKTAR